MSKYLEWNDAIARHFFSPDRADEAVWLYVNEELIADLGQHIGSGAAGFVEAVKTGPPWVTATGLCQRALHTLKGWRDRGLELPPYLGYLGLFVLAAGLEGDFSQREYYPRLRSLLGDPDVDAGTLPSFDRMWELWVDLETWSTRDRNGEFGVFTFRIAGKKSHIGLPIAQTILSEDERRALPRMFAEAGLDPTAAPPDDELTRMLRGGAELRKRTRELVRTRRDAESYAVLLDTVADELAAWDGTYEERPEGEAPARKAGFGTLRLCARLDRTAQRLSVSFRCRLKQEFPSAGLHLRGAGLPSLSCFDSGLPGWSMPLVVAETGDQFDSAKVDWREGFSLSEESLRWRFGLPGRRVRVLIDGRTEGLPGLVEVRQVPRGQKVYFLYMQTDWTKLAGWAEQECIEFSQVEIDAGLPDGWRLASCSGVVGDKLVRSEFPELSLAERVQLALVGGIRSGPGLGFFRFALPSVVVEGGDGKESVVCNGQVLAPAPGTRSYSIPDGLPVETRIAVEIVRDGQPVKGRSLYLTGEFEWRLMQPERGLNLLGRPATGESSVIAGALLSGRRVPVDAFSPPVMLTPGIDRNAPRILLIGRTPGQICSWPGDPDPDWSPVWAVPMKRRGHAVYCAGSIEGASPEMADPGNDPDRVRLWKLTLWHRRRRIKAPDEDPALAALWNLYVEAARRV